MLSGSDPQASMRKYLRIWIAIASIAVILRAVNLVVTQAHPSTLSVFDNRALRVMTSWLLYPALLPSIFWTARRFPLDPPYVLRDTAVHMLSVSVLAFVHMIAVSFLTFGFTPSTLTYFGWYLPLDLIAYWAGVCALHYYHEVQAREVVAERLRADLNEVQLKALRSQLNPHFLFNTLNTVSVLAMKGDSTAVLSVVTRLSTLLRRTLDESAPQETRLSEELQALSDYVEIQLVRFSDRLVMHWDVSPDTLHAAVPVMILQPLVENAIKHGIAAHCGAGVITVRSRIDMDELTLQVHNTVPPDSPPALEAATSSMGIGLKNTRSRLQHLYGTAQRLDYGQAADKGVMVTLAIPLRRLGDNQAVA
jgi:two-component system LytT family sensor kinase